MLLAEGLPSGLNGSRELDERISHESAIRVLSVRLGLSVERIRPVYEAELERVRPGAKIRDYIPLLVSHCVRRLVGHGEESHPSCRFPEKGPLLRRLRL